MTEKRDDEELFFFFIIGWALLETLPQETNAHLPTLAMQPAGPQQQQQDKVFASCVFSPWPRTIELLLHHSEINYCC